MRPARGYCDYRQARREYDVAFGDAEALYPVGARHPRDDVRGVSIRWLFGVLLTGASSVMLMGGALYSANDSRMSFAATPQLHFAGGDLPVLRRQNGKHDRLVVRTALRPVAKEFLDVETSSRIGDLEYIAVRPFLRLTTGMATSRSGLTADLPAFNSQAAFTQAGQSAPAEVEEISEGEVMQSAALVMSPLNDAMIADEGLLDEAGDDQTEIGAQVRQVAAFNSATTATPASAAAFAVMPVSLGLSSSIEPLNQFGPTELDAYAAIVRPGAAQNVTEIGRVGGVADLRDEGDAAIVSARSGESLSAVLIKAGADPASARLAQSTMDDKALKEGDQIEVVLDIEGHLRRASVFRGEAHVGTVVAARSGAFLAVGEPDDVELAAPRSSKGGAIDIYRSLYETALKHGLPRELADELVSIFTFDVDFKATIGVNDQLNVYTEVDPDTREPSAIVHASLEIDGRTYRYYRFRLEDGTYGYFNEEGRSARKFLTRKPIASGTFRSPFGMRRHPILGYSRLHAGVDYAAPRGTAIYAAGDGTVTMASWKGGYGNHVELRHTNGYETTYSHMTNFASGVRPGTAVRQGQVIGYVGSTGLSTGPHLHYEVHVNGQPVDPMRIKVPRTVEMSGEQLAAFEIERTRIDALMSRDTRVAELARR